MNKQDFNKLLTEIKGLNFSEIEKIKSILEQSGDENKVLSMIEARFQEQDCCPHCFSENYSRFGFAHGLQRYRCKSCNKTFNALTKTPLARKRNKDKWLTYLSAITDSFSVRKSAKIADISSVTSFYWRHSFLKYISFDKSETLMGITEADETYILYSEKGSRSLDRQPRKRGGTSKERGLSRDQVCVLVARDRYGNTIDSITGRGNISASKIKDNLLTSLDKDALLVSDGSLAYRSFSSKNNITHEAVNLSQNERVRGAYHVQNVNAYHSRLSGWMERFNGVATKYLHHYLGWRRMLETYKNITVEKLLLSSLGQFQHLT